MRFLILLFLSFCMMFNFVLAQQESDEPVRIGTKTFTESVILGEILKQSIEFDGHKTEIYKQLGGTRILWNALTGNEIDVYPDYTGTIIEEILAERKIQNREDLIAVLNDFGIEISKPLGFNNTYALGMKQERAEELDIETISDLQEHPELSFGFSNEFMDREDGWIGIQQVYQLQPQQVRGLDHDLAYRGLDAGNIDVIDLYSTDAEIDYYNLKVLEDDQSFFPEYEAVFLYRSDIDKEVVPSIIRFEGEISRDEMVQMNGEVKLEGMDDAVVASRFLAETSKIESEVSVEGFWDRLLRHTLDHLYLVGISLGLAIIIAIPIGVLAVKVKVLETAVLGAVGILQTIPSLALLVFMIPLFGIGAFPAIAALFLYSLLPIVRNTHSGIKTISEPIRESAKALGLPDTLILRKIELPMAVPSILAGIKTSAVINVGTATLGALIGAGGYGQPILTGIRLDSVPLILEGAIPAAVLALLVQGLFDLVERWLVQ
jgi:osmoprotectant transport system permease protein